MKGRFKMSESKKERVMSPKGFLHKSTTKAAASAAAFLAQHRAWLETGELAKVTSPILAKVDSKDLMPTPALEEIKVVVLNHMIASEIRKGEEQMAAREAGPQSTPKNWIATIYTAKGEVATRTKVWEENVEVVNAQGERTIKKVQKSEVEDLEESFDLSQEADRWTDRKLVEGATDCFGVITHATMTIKGEPFSTTVTRNDAMARVLRVGKGPVMKPQAKGTGKLSFGVKVHNDRSRFSGG
jgi:hypothetical protein